MASICCSPPDSEPADLRAAIRQDREQVVDTLAIDPIAAMRAAIAADGEIVLDRQVGKQPPAFRHQRDAQLDPLHRRTQS